MKLNQEKVIQSLQTLPVEQRKELYKELAATARESNLKIGETFLPFINIPYFVDKSLFHKARRSLDTIMDILIKLEEYALSSEGKQVYERLMRSLTPASRELVEQCACESKEPLLKGHCSFDSYFNITTGDISVIEVDQAAPPAVWYHDAIHKIGGRLLEALGLDPGEKYVAPSILDWFVSEYRGRYPGGFPDTIALVIEHESPSRFTDLPTMAREVMKLAGEQYNKEMKIITCFPYDLSLKEGKIYYDTTEIKMIWRNSVYMNTYKKEGKDIADYLAICRAQDEHLLINSSRIWLTRNKETFALLWDKNLWEKMGLTEEEIGTIKNVVPESVNLKYNPEQIDEVIYNREKWMSKPSDAGFGEGVEFGSSHTIESWNKKLYERSANYGYIFQKRVDYTVDTVYNLEKDGTINAFKAEFDFCPHHIDGAFTDTVLSRATIIEEQSKINKMNLVSGGYLLPLMLI